jgi:hypothetical protein
MVVNTASPASITWRSPANQAARCSADTANDSGSDHDRT